MGWPIVKFTAGLAIPNAAVSRLQLQPNQILSLKQPGTSLTLVWLKFCPSTIIGGAIWNYFERFITVSIVYWIVNILIEILGRHIERRLDIEDSVTIDLPKSRSDLMIYISSQKFQVKRF